jgi:hypothetical protein
MSNILNKSFFITVLSVYKALADDSKLKVLLLTDEAIPTSESTYEELIVNEVEGEGYTIGGKVLTGVLIEDSYKLKANNVTWSDSTITARYAVIYDDTEILDSDKQVVCVFDFGINKECSNGIFEISWDVNGFINLEQE